MSMYSDPNCFLCKGLDIYWVNRMGEAVCKCECLCEAKNKREFEEYKKSKKVSESS